MLSAARFVKNSVLFSGFKHFGSLFPAVLVACVSLLVSGCGMSTPVVPGHSLAVTGSMHGGQQPVTGATLQLYAVGTTGDGSAATPLLTTKVTTSDGTGNAGNANANTGNAFNSLTAGSFTITGDYTCPSPTTQVYLVGTGGNPGLSANVVNPKLAMLALLGPCGNLTAATQVQINELTTIGSLAPIAQYMNGYATLGSASGDAAQFVAALDLVRAYADTASGTVPGPDLPAGMYASSAEITTLADILAGCINSDGTGVCQQLFTLATPPGGIAPTDTIGAAVDILKFPTNHAAEIFALLPPGAPFQPTLSAPPTAWTFPIVPYAATPVISPASGSYSVAPTVTITHASPSATIYYTTNNTTPTTASSVYNGPFTLTTSAEPTRIVRAIAVGNGFATSAMAVATYTLPSGGTGSALAFLTQPADSVVNAAMPGVRVGLVDAYGNLVPDHFKGITVSLASNPTGATLGGTLTGGTSTGDGSFTFTGLSVNKVGAGYTLQAASSGYASAVSTSFNITPTPIVFTTAGALIGAGATLPGTFTLPTVAPAGGLVVTLTSSNESAITIAPATVTLNAGDTTGSFTYTSVGTGAATLRASAPGYTDGTISETTATNFITIGTLPSAPGSAQALPITLSQPAPAGGLTVTLTSSNSAVATVNGPAIFAAGATSPSNIPNIQIKSFGTTTITATATGYAPDSRVLNINTAATLTQNVTLPKGSSVFETLTLSPVPSTGIVINLKSDNAAIATVPSTVFYQANASNVVFQVTGAGVGSTTIHASGAGVPDTTAGVAVTGVLSLTNGSPGVGLYSPATVNLTSVPVSPISLTITSSNPAQLLLTTNPSIVGSASITLNNVTGSSVTFYEQGLASASPTVTVTSASYTTVSSAVTIRLPIISFQFPTNIQTVSTLTTPTFFASLGENINSNFVPCISVTTGLGTCALNPGGSATVSLTSSSPATATIDTNSLTFTPSVTNIAVKLTPVAAGVTNITLGASPAGYGFLSGLNFFNTTVVQPTFTMSTPGTAAGVTTRLTGNLSIAETNPNGTTVTVAVGSPIASISLDPNVMGGQTLTLPNIGNNLPIIYLQGLASGSTTLTYSAPGYKTVTQTLPVGNASAIFGNTNSLNINTADVPATITLKLSCAGTTTPSTCFLNPTTDNHFTVVSSNTSIATVTNSFVIAPGTGSVSGTMTGLAAGSATLSIGPTPSPLVAPTTIYGSISTTINVTQSKFFPNASTTGAGLYVSSSFTAGPRSDGAATVVTFTSSNPSVAVLSTSATILGSASFVHSYATSQSFTYYVQGLAAGTSNLTLSAPGYADSTAVITVLPSGVVFFSGAATFSRNAFAVPLTLTIYLAELNATTGAVAAYCGASTCALNPGNAVTFDVTSSNTNAGTISASPLTIAPGGATTTTTFVPNDVGTTTIAITEPAGFIAGAAGVSSGTATVTGDTIVLADIKTAAGLMTKVGPALNSTPGRPVTMTVTLVDPSLGKLSTDPTVMGTATSLTFTNITCLDPACADGHGPPYFYLQGTAPGYTKLLVTANGYMPYTATVAVYKAGITLFANGAVYTVDNVPTNGNAKVGAIISYLDPYSLSLVSDCISLCAVLNPGVTPAFTLVPDDPTIGVFSPSLPYDPATGIIFAPYTGLKNGTMNFSLGTQSAGFYNTTTASRKTGQASSVAKNDLTYALIMEGHDIDAGAGVQVQGDFGLSATTTNILSLQIHLQVSDPSVAVISTSPTVAGSAALDFSGLNNIHGSFYLQGLKVGTTTITISGDQYISRTITVHVRPAGFAFRQFDFTAKIINHDAGAIVTPVVLNDAGQWMANAQLNPGTTATVQMSSSNPAAGTILNSTVTFAANAASASGTFHPIAPGASTISLGATSAGFIQATTYQSVVITVQ